MVVDPGLPRPAGIVFDMDGLLLDSERLAREAYVAVCGALGVAADLEAYARCIGGTAADTEAILTATLGPRVPYGEFERRWSELYQARIEARPVDLKPGARELLEALAGWRIPRALATSTARPTAIRKLTDTGIIGYFACLICGGETPRGKPHPDPYVAALTGLGIPARAAWALEDSDNGVRSAHAAGLRVFQVPDLVAPSTELLELGHHVAADLHGVLDILHDCPNLRTVPR